MNAKDRIDWIDEVDFDVPVFGKDGEDTFRRLRVPVLGRLRRRLRGPREEDHQGRRRAAAIAGVKFMVLGEGETCTGDSARRAGNEFLFQQLAMQNVEVLNEIKATKIVVTCPHCFNTLEPRVPAAGRQLHGAAPHPAAQPAGQGRAAEPVGPVSRRHLPRPVLPRPAQQGLRRAARADRRLGCVDRDGPARRAVILLRRRRRAHVDGGDTSASGSTRTRRGGDPHRRHQDRHGLPVLPGDAHRRRYQPQAEGKAEGVEVVDVATLLLGAGKS